MNGITLPDISLPILDAIDHNVNQNPDYPLFCFEAENGGVENIGWGRAGNAFNIAAHAILAGLEDGITLQHQRAKGGQKTIGILASLDSVTFYSVIVGVLKAGCVPFLISIRNTPEAISNLLYLTKCTTILSTSDAATEGLVTASIKLFEECTDAVVHRLPAPSFAQLYGPNVVPTMAPVIARKSTQEIMDSPCVLSHSSGTTSLPKPIMLTHRMISQVGFRNRMDPDSTFKCRVMSAHALPMFHMMGFTLIPWSTMLGLTLSMGRPRTPPILPSPDVVLRGALKTNASIVYCAPTFLEAWATDPSNMSAMRSFHFIMYGGGPVRDDIATLLVDNGVNLLPIMGLSETNVISSFNPKHIKTEGPAWYETDPLLDIVLVPEDEDKLKGVYRILMKGNSVRQPSSYDTTLKGIPAFDTKDLVILHPKNPKLWKVVGRADDQITHSTGEKTNPVPIEAILEQSPYIKVALMFGRARLQPGLLITPGKDHAFDITDYKKFDVYLNLIWGAITTANQSSPTHSRIFREMIIVADPAKPFEYTAKGSLRRQATITKYEKEIEQLYDVTEASKAADIEKPKSLDRVAIKNFIRTVVHKILEREVTDEDDVFRTGTDSLCALSIRVAIARGLLSSGLVSQTVTDSIPRDLVYLYPSIDTMTDLIGGAAFLNGKLGGSRDPVQFSLEEDLQWQAILQCPDVLVEISPSRSGTSPPLVLLSGGGGGIDLFRPMMKYKSGVYGLKVVPETPRDSLEAIAEFNYKLIKQKLPHGPYRIASYSGTSALLMVLASVIARAGDTVAQVGMMDHFPALFLPGIDPALALTHMTATDAAAWLAQHVLDQQTQFVDLLMPSMNVRQRLVSNTVLVRRNEEFMASIRDVGRGNPVTERIGRNMAMFNKLSLEFLMSELFTVAGGDGHRVWSFELFRKWVGALGVRLTIFVATEGVNIVLSDVLAAKYKSDLAARHFLGEVPVNIVSVEGDHLSFLMGEDLQQSMDGAFVNTDASI